MIERRHLVFADGILKRAQRVVFGGWAREGRRDCEDGLSQREQRVAEILWFTHFGRMEWIERWLKRELYASNA